MIEVALKWQVNLIKGLTGQQGPFCKLMPGMSYLVVRWSNKDLSARHRLSSQPCVLHRNGDLEFSSV